MIPEIVFDTENYDQIFEEARGKIASIYPEWTDYNYHDPGITMLELFAWLKEGQQFYLDQTGEEQKDKFLKLLGTKRQRKEAAYAMLTMNTKQNLILPKGMPFYADTISYESVTRNYILKEDIMKCFYGRERILEYIDKRQIEFGHKLKLYMFGNTPSSGDAFYIGLNAPLPPHMEVSIFFDLFEDYEVMRNPLTNELAVPFSSFRVEYFTKQGWLPVCNLKDETYGFLQDGQIFFELKEDMVKGNVYGESGYFLRIYLTSAEYDVPPVLTGLGINVLKVRQAEHLLEHGKAKDFLFLEDRVVEVLGDTFLTLYGENDIYIETNELLQEIPVFEKYLDAEQAVCKFRFVMPEGINKISSIYFVNENQEGRRKKTIGFGNGYPNQVYELFDEYIEYDSFALMVEKEEGMQKYVIWEKVSDFAASTPEDRHYILDTRTGRIQFGDSIHGLAPEGEIRILSYVRTLGKEGQVKAGKINQMAKELSVSAVVYNPKGSVGGLREETYEESFIRVQKELKCPVTAVTYEDYEGYVRKTPGLMIANCKALTPGEVKEIFPYYDESAITMVVKPFAKLRGKKLMGIYRKNILQYLEQFRMTGTSIYLIRPEYVQFELYVEVVIKSHYIQAEEEMKKTVEEYFQALGKEFGGCVRYSKLYGVIDMLPYVKQLRTLTLEVKGAGVKHLPDGSIQVPPNGVVELEHVEYQFTMG